MGKLLGFLRVNGKNESQKSANAESEYGIRARRDSEASRHCAIED
jgi:hypothetical protein